MDSVRVALIVDPVTVTCCADQSREPTCLDGQAMVADNTCRSPRSIALAWPQTRMNWCYEDAVALIGMRDKQIIL